MKGGGISCGEVGQEGSPIMTAPFRLGVKTGVARLCGGGAGSILGRRAGTDWLGPEPVSGRPATMKRFGFVSIVSLLMFAAAPCFAQNAATLHIGVEPSTLHAGIEPSTLYVGSEPASLYIGIEPSTLSMGVEPSTLHLGIEPANLYIGIEPSIFYGLSGSNGADGGVGAEPSFLAAFLWMPGRHQSLCSFNRRARFSACERVSLNITSTESSLKTPISGE